MTVLVADEVALAIAGGHPVVALETSVIGQGLPQPRNLECVERMSAAIRERDAVPAWIAVIDGALLAGLDDAQLERVATSGEAVKVARRDLPVAVARGDLGATTVSATIWAASRAGIGVTATGGIGGVHTGDRADVSADLDELARTPGLLVCSGPKSIVDPVATLERLEELGVVVVGYGVDRLPFFLSREAPVELEHRVDTPGEAAAILAAQARLRIASTIVLCNPVPERERARCRRGPRGDGARGGADGGRGRDGQGGHALPARGRRSGDRRPLPHRQPGPSGVERRPRRRDRRAA